MTDERQIRNARITGTSLGTHDHGIATCMLILDYSGSGQGFGGYALDDKPKERAVGSERRGSAYGMEFILRVLRTVGVERWEDLVGKHVRVEASWNLVYAIGHITEDKWFRPEQLAEEMGLGGRAQ